MFYGKTSGEGAGAGRGSRNDRFEQMVKQQQLIEQKKQEIQARADAELQKKALEALGKPRSWPLPSGASSTSSSTTSQRSGEEKQQEAEDVKPVTLKNNAFSNDGSFFEQFKRMQEEALKKKKDEEEKAAKVKIKEEPIEFDDYGNRINKAPMIKIINPESLRDNARSASPNNHNRDRDRDRERPRETVGVPPPHSYYNVPPPPPPPPGKPNQDVKPYFGGGNQHQVQGGFQNLPPPPPPPPQGGPPQKQFGSFPSPTVRAMASVIADEGDHVEERLKMKHQGDPLMWFLFKPDSTEYRTFKMLVDEMKEDNKTHMYNQAPPPPPFIKFEKFKSEPVEPEFSERPSFASDSSPSLKREASSFDEEESERERRERKRKSRWGPQATDVNVPPVGIAAPPELGQHVSVINPVSHPDMNMAVALPGSSAGMNLMSMPLIQVQSSPGPGALSKVTRASPQLLAYARQAYGRTDLDDDEWKQCEEAYKMNLVFQDIARKKAKDEELERAGKFKHEYDSDEEVDGGTWEHKQRIKEMEKTRNWADELTQKAKGKHHIGDFLPPEELAKFMEKYKAVKEGKRLDESEYEEYKIQQDNIGFKMLQKMGWSAGEGLGSTGQGIVAPIDKGNVPSDKQGLGIEQPGDLTEEDDEFTAYRKRMMLAYRFRPNPLNNPRRAYY